MIRPKLYLHIGWHKTGTTSIQSFMWKNRDLLQDVGCLYPETGCLSGAHYPFSEILLGASSQNATCREIWNELAREVDQKRPKRIVLSSEDFILAKDPLQLVDVTRGYETTIVVYVRRQDHLLESVYNQQVREPSRRLSLPLREFVKNNLYNVLSYIDFGMTLDRWHGAFGRNRIKVRVFEKEQLPTGVVSDFLKATNLRIPGVEIEDKILNRSMSANILEFLRICNESEMSRDDHLSLVDDLLTLQRDCPEYSSVASNPSLLSPSERLSLLESYRESNSQVARDFLGKSDGRLFLESEPAEGMRLSSAPSLDTKGAVAIARWLWQLQRNRIEGDGAS